MFWLCCMTWTRAGTEASVSELFFSSSLFNVLLAFIAAHMSLTQASVKFVISTLQERRQTGFNEEHAKIYWWRWGVWWVFKLTPVPPADSLDAQLHPTDVSPLRRPLYLALHSKTWVKKSHFSALSRVSGRLPGSNRIVASCHTESVVSWKWNNFVRGHLISEKLE